MKDFVCKSTVKGRVKHVIFSHPSTQCFRFGFVIGRLKTGGLRIRARFPNGYLSHTPIPPYLYRELIEAMKGECRIKFGQVNK
jgi:hypothetical protein